MAFTGTINLATGQFAKDMAEFFYHESFIGNNFNKKFTFNGVKGLTVLSPITQPLRPYGLNDPLSDVLTNTIPVTRFGPLSEVEDAKQDLVMGQSYSFNLTLERQNRDDQVMLKDAGTYLRDEVREQVVPAMDKYTFHKWISWTYTSGEPGSGITNETGPALTDATAVQAILDAETAFMNAGVPENNRIVYVPASVYAKLRLSNLFVQGPEAQFIKETITRGTVGMIGSMQIVRIPDTYLVNADATQPGGVYDHSDVQFLAIHTPAVLRPVKIEMQRIIPDSPFLDGWMIQGHYYFDAFVLAAQASGVYVYTTATTPAGGDPDPDPDPEVVP